MSDLHITNAKLVTPDAVVQGGLRVENGRIVEVGASASASTYGETVDLNGDYLLPGLIELHTDHLETHVLPRPKVRWPLIGAVLAHDAQIAACGITTVFDALRVGMDEDAGLGAKDMRAMADTIRDLQARGHLRAEHRLHLRCEVTSPDVEAGFALFADDPALALVSLMDHTPGQRQFVSMTAYRTYFQGKKGFSAAEMDAFIARRQAEGTRYATANRARLVPSCRARGLTLASHDDATAEHIEEAAGFGIHLAEFPTTLAAARHARAHGMRVLMGAPNVVRGGSHSGNVGAAELAEAGLLDCLSSDYVPGSLLHAAFLLAAAVEAIDLPAASALISAQPAASVGLDDRGRLALGLRADLVRVAQAAHGGVPVVRGVWREGQRVA